MKSSRKPNDVDGLLDAVLVDAEWQSLDRVLQSDAVAVLGTVRRRRRLRLAMAQVTSVAAVLLVAVWGLHSLGQSRRAAAGVSAQPVRSALDEVLISEDQMLAMFPPGSCAIAEVDGKKELVFFDAQKAHEGFIVDGR
jgi:hypothetical protein